MCMQACPYCNVSYLFEHRSAFLLVNTVPNNWGRVMMGIPRASKSRGDCLYCKLATQMATRAVGTHLLACACNMVTGSTAWVMR